jgi:hypothetical protein
MVLISHKHQVTSSCFSNTFFWLCRQSTYPFPDLFTRHSANNQLIPSQPYSHVTLSTLHVPMNPRTGQFSPSSPRQTKENPTMAPTMLWLADTGSFRNVAPSIIAELPTVTVWLCWCVSSEHTASHPISASVYHQLAGISPCTLWMHVLNDVLHDYTKPKPTDARCRQYVPSKTGIWLFGDAVSYQRKTDPNVLESHTFKIMGEEYTACFKT